MPSPPCLWSCRSTRRCPSTMKPTSRSTWPSRPGPAVWSLPMSCRRCGSSPTRASRRRRSTTRRGPRPPPRLPAVYGRVSMAPRVWMTPLVWMTLRTPGLHALVPCDARAAPRHGSPRSWVSTSCWSVPGSRTWRPGTPADPGAARVPRRGRPRGRIAACRSRQRARGTRRSPVAGSGGRPVGQVTVALGEGTTTTGPPSSWRARPPVTRHAVHGSPIRSSRAASACSPGSRRSIHTP